MRRRTGGCLAALTAVAVLAGCGVRAQRQPEILPTPPAPTATPSADEQSSPAGRTASPPAPARPGASRTPAPSTPAPPTG